MHGWQSKSVDRTKGDLCFLDWLQWLQWSPHPHLLDVVWCSAVAVVPVVWWSCSCSVVQLV